MIKIKIDSFKMSLDILSLITFLLTSKEVNKKIEF